MGNLHNYQSDPVHEDIRGFQLELAKYFPDEKPTSTYRPNAKTKQGKDSHHAHGKATDYRLNPKLKDFLWNTPEGISLLNKYNLGMLDESEPQNKKFGNALHIGKDSVLVERAKKRYSELIPQQTEQKLIDLQGNYENTTFASVPDVYKEEEQQVQQQSAPQEKEQQQIQIPQYFNVTDRVNQNFGGTETNYRWYPDQPLPPSLSTQTYPDGTPMNIRQVVPVYQDGGDMYGNPISIAQKGGKTKTIYVESENDPRYRAYQDSLRLYNISEKWLKEIPVQNIQPLSKDMEEEWAHSKIKPIGQKKDKQTNYKGETIYPVFKKPQQPVIVKRPILENINITPKGLAQTNTELTSNLNITPQARIPQYFNVTDRVNQNFGGTETNYRWYPDQPLPPSLSTQTYEDGTPMNTRTMIPVFQSGGDVQLDKEWLQNWYNNRVIPAVDVQEAFLQDLPYYQERLKDIPNPTLVEFIEKNNPQVTGRVNYKDNQILVTPNAQDTVYTHEANHYVNSFPSVMRTVHKNIVDANLYKKDDSRLPINMAEKYNYYSDPDEVHSRVMVLRKTMGLKPDEKVTKEKLETYLQQYEGNDTNILDIINLTDINGLLEMLNYMASNNNLPNRNLQFAQQGGVIQNDLGQWLFPGQITEINSPNITMQGVPYPVLGVADTGEQKMMMPNQEYYFEGAKTVTEYPQLTPLQQKILQIKNKLK